MTSEETAIFSCRKVSLPVAVNTMDECVKTLCAWRDTRKKLTGLSTKGPNGFIANKTICCLETNMLTMKEVLVMVERPSGGGGGVTRPCARARQAKRVLTQGRTGASRDKSLKMT